MKQELVALAARQCGVFTSKQALKHGLGYSSLRHLVDRNRLVVLHQRVYGIAGAPETWDRSITAALLAAGPGAAASHRSAGRMWRITDEGDDTVEITVPQSHCPRLDGVVVHRSVDLVADHVSMQAKLPVTKPARVILDLGAVLGREGVEDALDRALARRLITVAGVEWMLNEVSRRGRSGAGVARRILDQRALGRQVPDGLLEPRMARLLERARLPDACFQYTIRTSEGRFLAVVDFAYPEVHLAIEVDGYAVHGTPRAMAKDFVRQNGLVAEGWHVLRFTWHQVVSSPDTVAQVVAEAVARLAA